LKVIYKLLAIYTFVLIAFFAFLTLPILNISKVTYTWNSYEYIIGKYTLIPVIIFAVWSLFKKESRKA